MTGTDELSQRYYALLRDFQDLAVALGVEPSFVAMAQRVADLLTDERCGVVSRRHTPPVASSGEE